MSKSTGLPASGYQTNVRSPGETILHTAPLVRPSHAPPMLVPFVNTSNVTTASASPSRVYDTVTLRVAFVVNDTEFWSIETPACAIRAHAIPAIDANLFILKSSIPSSVT